jgi:hypothetical protein
LCLVADLHEAVTGPSLKAGDITPSLEWMTTSNALVPPGRADSRGLEVLQLCVLVQCSSHLQVSLRAQPMVAGGVELCLEEVEFDGQLVNLIVQVSVPLDLAGDAPVPHISGSISKHEELIDGSDEEVSEPSRDRGWWDDVGIGVILRVRLHI